MSTMSDRRVRWDIGWFGSQPAPNRPPLEPSGIAFFIECMHCDRWCDSHMLRCSGEGELAQLFALYFKRLHIVLFPMYPEDFAELARRTWADAAYQEARAKKRPKKRPKKRQKDRACGGSAA